MKKIAHILMPTVRRLAPHIGAENAWCELTTKGLLPLPHVIIGCSAGAAAGASCLPFTARNLKRAAEIYARLEPKNIASLPPLTKALAGLTIVATLAPVVNWAIRKVSRPANSADRRDFYVGAGETLSTWALIGLLTYNFWTRESVFVNDRLRKLFLKNLDFEGFFNSDVLFEALATDLETGEEAVFTNYLPGDKNRKRIVEGLLASTAIMGHLPPSKIDGRILGDGGALSRIPLHRAACHQVDGIVVMYYHSTFEYERGPFRWPEAIVRSSEISEVQVTRRTRENYELRLEKNEILPPVLELIIEDGEPRLPNIELGNFCPDDMVKGMNMGYNAVYDNLEKLREFCGT